MANTAPTEALRALVDQASAVVDSLYRPENELQPTILAETWDGRVVAIGAASMANTAEETAFRVGLPQVLRRAGFRRWVFFSEAWMAAYAAGEPATTLPKDRPEHVEVVAFHAEDRDGNQASASRQLAGEGERRRLLPLVAQECVFLMEGFPGGAVEVSRLEDGTYWAHIIVNRGQTLPIFGDGLQGARGGVVDSRIDWDERRFEGIPSLPDGAALVQIAVRIRPERPA